MVATSHGRISLLLQRESLSSTRPVVLVVHGALRDSRTLTIWMTAFSPRFDVIFADMPGHGLSPAEGPATIVSIADRLREVISAHFSQRSIVVMGESTGGIIACALGDGRLSAVRGVIAGDPPLTTAKQWPVQMSFAKLLATAPDGNYVHTFAKDVFGIAKDGSVEERVYYQHARDVAVPTLMLTGDVPLWPRVSKPDVPCLLDETDRQVIQSFGNDKISFEQIKGTGHLLLWKPTDACRARILDFCEKTLYAPPKSVPAPAPARAPAAANAVGRPRIAELLAEKHFSGARAMAKQYWRAEPSASSARYIMGQFEKLNEGVRTSTRRVSFVRSFTVEPMLPMLQAEAALDGCRLETWVGDFNAYGQDILNPASGLYASKPDTVVFAVLLRDVSPALSEGFADLSEADVEAEIARVADMVTSLLTALRDRSSAHILVHGFERPVDASMGILDQRQKVGQADAIMALNARIRAYAAGQQAVTVLDYEDLQSRFGRAKWADDRKWMTARLPISVDAMPVLARAWWQSIAPLARPQAKVLVLDLDNTMWGGTVGEDGYAGLKIGNDYPGAYFVKLQRTALDLARRGVLLAIASKNNEADAMEVLTKHPGMLLRPEHFATHRINWKPKPENIIDMAKELNLGLDSFVFMDDNPAERDAVRRGCPEVNVVELPTEASTYADLLRAVVGFERHSILDEDKSRGRYYREERERRDLMTGTGSLENYLEALNVSVTIEHMSAATLARCAQLTQKTNQLNMTTRRYTEAEVAKLAADRGADVFVLHASDRFGDNGLVGVAITRTEGTTCEIDSFLLSCRVIGRSVEKALAHHIAESARARGAKSLVGWFLPTAKNAPAAEIYKSCGFNVAQTTDTGGQLWTLDLTSQSVEVPHWIALNSAPLVSVA
jgi:FkbH-like protein